MAILACGNNSVTGNLFNCILVGRLFDLILYMIYGNIIFIFTRFPSYLLSYNYDCWRMLTLNLETSSLLAAVKKQVPLRSGLDVLDQDWMAFSSRLDKFSPGLFEELNAL